MYMSALLHVHAWSTSVQKPIFHSYSMGCPTSGLSPIVESTRLNADLIKPPDVIRSDNLTELRNMGKLCTLYRAERASILEQENQKKGGYRIPCFLADVLAKRGTHEAAPVTGHLLSEIFQPRVMQGG